MYVYINSAYVVDRCTVLQLLVLSRLKCLNISDFKEIVYLFPSHNQTCSYKCSLYILEIRSIMALVREDFGVLWAN